MKKDDDSVPAFKVLLIGSQGAGKSSLIQKYVHNRFSYDYSVTVGIEFFTREIEVNERTKVKVQLWDTMGQEAYKAIVKSHYKGVSAVLLLFALDKKESFDSLPGWLREIKDNTHAESLVFLVGTKLDLDHAREVARSDALAYSRAIDAAHYAEISSKTGENVKELFDRVAKILFKKYSSCKAFKELVKPFQTKSQSFTLRKFGALYNQNQREKNCC